MNRRRLGLGLFTKKTDDIDHWLDSQGLYRKHIARDGTCLFRVVAEQIYLTQRYHVEVRKQCMNYIAAHKDKFAELIDGSLEQYVKKMCDENQWGGKVEIEAMAMLYKRDMVVYFEMGKAPMMATKFGMSKQINLCLSYGNHYDIVYSKDDINNAALSQSIVYELLYEKVFGLTELDYAVDQMLHQKVQQDHRNPFSSLEPFKMRENSEVSEECTNMKTLIQQGVTPFPYKVAKALEPSMYRNIAFDVWSDMRKELRLASQTAGDLQVGMKCLVTLEHSESLHKIVRAGPATCHAHIQRVFPDKGPVEVYVEELGERRMVSHSQLEPLQVVQRPFFIRQYPYRHPVICSDKNKKKLQRVRKAKQDYEKKCKNADSGQHLVHNNAEFPVVMDSPSHVAMFSMPVAPPAQLFRSPLTPTPGSPSPVPRLLLDTGGALPTTPPPGSAQFGCDNVVSPFFAQPVQKCCMPNNALPVMLPENGSHMTTDGDTSPASTAGYGTGTPSPPLIESTDIQNTDINQNNIKCWNSNLENLEGNNPCFADMRTIHYFFKAGSEHFHHTGHAVNAPLAEVNRNYNSALPVNSPEAVGEGVPVPGVGWQFVNPGYEGAYIQCNNYCSYSTPVQTMMYYPMDITCQTTPVPCCQQTLDGGENNIDMNGPAKESIQSPLESPVMFSPSSPVFVFHPGAGTGFSHSPEFPDNQGTFSPPPLNGFSFPLTPTPVPYPPTPHGVPFSPTLNQMFTFTPPPPLWFQNQPI